MTDQKKYTPKQGDIVKVHHQRKGTFTMQITNVSHEWIDGVIIEGVAKAMLNYNVAYEGDDIMCRISLCRFSPISSKGA